ncbi:regulatory protein RecX [Mesohalobacter halotolerans]|uniref:Regulatory protein RecX n=1 Tax=Mesohalobacter halotolerans TaxID=1883405 RepID=A0A4U5TVG3_9FLAO|nr:regulatory protein RecX [Mesohalobacter halotolerans]MBS3738493.1 RecX family transcriptional regulator [Psychroflexus sp.]TKS57594.1 recombinase RecX [Mesohalobacter halotolerans]
MKETTKSYTVQEAFQALCRYCVYQDRCHQEVEQKLIDMNMIPEARAQIISDLIRHDFLNEERFAMNYAMGKFNQKGWGKIRIRQELKRRKVSDFLLKKALDQIEDRVYRKKIKDLAQKKFSQLGKDTSWKSKSKLKNYLMYKGFEPDIIYETINNFMKF